MIIGNGLIASLFKGNNKENTILFASGVSNSLETDQKEFRREEKLLRTTIQENENQLLLYFSTCSIYDSSKSRSAYVHHKMRMETIIEELAPTYLILRASNAVGRGGNPHLLLNYVTHNIRNQIPIQLHTQASRNLIDVEDLKNITLQLLRDKHQNTTINVASPHHYTMTEIIATVESVLGKKAIVTPMEAGQTHSIYIPTVKDYFIQENKMDKTNYLLQLVRKYY